MKIFWPPATKALSVSFWIRTNLTVSGETPACWKAGVQKVFSDFSISSSRTTTMPSRAGGG